MERFEQLIVEIDKLEKAIASKKIKLDKARDELISICNHNYLFEAEKGLPDYNGYYVPSMRVCPKCGLAEREYKYEQLIECEGRKIAKAGSDFCDKYVKKWKQ